VGSHSRPVRPPGRNSHSPEKATTAWL
jgi:hypothetical protein